jgi:hypothetical protein
MLSCWLKLTEVNWWNIGCQIRWQSNASRLPGFQVLAAAWKTAKTALLPPGRPAKVCKKQRDLTWSNQEKWWFHEQTCVWIRNHPQRRIKNHSCHPRIHVDPWTKRCFIEEHACSWWLFCHFFLGWSQIEIRLSIQERHYTCQQAKHHLHVFNVHICNTIYV